MNGGSYRYAADPLWVLCVGLYALNQLVLKPAFHHWWLHGYLNDLLVLPCALPLVLWLHARLGWRVGNMPPSLGEVFGHWAVWSCCCEWIGPHFVAVTADSWDIVAYGMGGVMAWAWWNRRTLFHIELPSEHDPA